MAEKDSDCRSSVGLRRGTPADIKDHPRGSNRRICSKGSRPSSRHSANPGCGDKPRLLVRLGWWRSPSINRTDCISPSASAVAKLIATVDLPSPGKGLVMARFRSLTSPRISRSFIRKYLKRSALGPSGFVNSAILLSGLSSTSSTGWRSKPHAGWIDSLLSTTSVRNPGSLGRPDLQTSSEKLIKLFSLP